MLEKSNTKLILAAMLAASAVALPSDLAARSYTFQFACLGDSWASGVTYGINGYTNYDKNDQNPPCMRINHAYSVQLENDWAAMRPNAIGAAKPNLNFVACSGARLVDMVQGQHQLSKTPSNTHLVLMQAGGNDAGFYRVASDCIFHQEQSTDYGETYPGKGRCLDSINAARDFVSAPDNKDGTLKYTIDTIKDILNDERGKQSVFKLYVIGYAHFFNTNDNWCSKSSFSLNFNELKNGKRSPLTAKLRADINDLTQRLNDQLKAAVAHVNSDKVRYIDVTKGYDGHRFCEDNHNLYDQYFNDDVWFWNASPSHFWSANVLGAVEQAVEDVTYANVYVYNKDPKNADKSGWNWDDLLREDKNVHAQSPNQNGSPGLALRPFHPKEAGHKAIKDAIKPQALKDFPLW